MRLGVSGGGRDAPPGRPRKQIAAECQASRVDEGRAHGCSPGPPDARTAFTARHDPCTRALAGAGSPWQPPGPITMKDRCAMPLCMTISRLDE